MNNERVRVYQAADAIEAHLLQGLLCGEGLDVQLRGEHLLGGVGELPPTAITVDIYVFELAKSQAEAIIATYLKSKKTDLADWKCNACGETNSGHFEICWQCQKDPDER